MRNGDDAQGNPEAPSAPRLVLRMLVGAIMSAIEDGGRALRDLDSGVSGNGLAAPELLPAPSARHVLVGALAAGPGWLNGLLLAGRQAVSGPARRASLGVRAVARFLPTRELSAWVQDLETRARATALKLAEVGRREEQQGRALARAASGSLFARILDHVAESPQLQTVIREQSAGMGRSALSTLRERSQRADALAESVAGRLLPGHKSNGGRGSERG